MAFGSGQFRKRADESTCVRRITLSVRVCKISCPTSKPASCISERRGDATPPRTNLCAFPFRSEFCPNGKIEPVAVDDAISAGSQKWNRSNGRLRLNKSCWQPSLFQIKEVSSELSRLVDRLKSYVKHH